MEKQDNCKIYDNTVDIDMQKSIEKALLTLTEHKISNKNIERPNVSVLRGLFVFVICGATYLVCLFFIDHIAVRYGYSRWVSVVLINTIALFILFVNIKYILIWLIKIYQRFASDKLRRSCVFIPSCSEYMIESIKLKGTIMGLLQGIKRLTRCHYPNGGIDNP